MRLGGRQRFLVKTSAAVAKANITQQEATSGNMLRQNMFKRKDIMVLTSEDIEKIDKFEQIMNRGFFASGTEVTDLYNKIFDQKLSYTNCSSCIRTRISKMVTAKRRYLEELAKAEENKPQVEEKKEETTNESHKGSDGGKKGKGRSKKNDANG